MKTKLLPLLLLAFATTAFAEDNPEFTKNGDGTVTHNPTGLILKTCAEGQTWDSSFGICNGTAATYAATDVLKLTSDFVEQNDWRLPTKEELKAIGESVKFSTASNANFIKSFFPQTPTSYFWSSTDGVVSYYGRSCPYTAIYPVLSYCSYKDYNYDYNYLYNYKGSFAYSYDKNHYESKSSIPYSVVFNTGEYSPTETTTAANNVRLIRGTQWFGTLPKNTNATLITDFLNNNDGSVTHTKTGLTWQRCSVGQTWNEVDCDGTATPLTYEKATALTSDLGGKTDWRLPTFQELRTLIDKDNKIETFVFPHAPTGKFWSSVNYTGGDKSNAFYVSFNDSYVFYAPKKDANLVRLVRGTPLDGTVIELNPNVTKSPTSTVTTTPVATGNVDLVSTLTANPSPAKKGGDLTYTATITNKGSATATGAKVTFFVAPKFMTFKSSSANCDYSGGLSAVCQIGDLEAGANVTKTMTVTLKKAGGISSSVSAKANEKDANPADNIGKTATGVKK